VVGESGSGKSTLARVITKLQKADKGGCCVVLGQDVLGLKGEPLRRARREMQMVFQDPITSLNPALTVYETLAEPMRAHVICPEAELPKRVEALLKQVGLPGVAQRYPHQFSGGQRQRIAIARALALNPALIIADEPVSALDVSIQGQILALFKELQETNGTSFVFISHDLRVISHVAHQVLVLKHGKVMEYGSAAQVLGKPQAAYTKQLLKAVV
jgi:ABC-type glutathione transport system ATPase component